MATNFPTSLDALTNPTSSDSLSSPSHSAQHANVNDAVEALQAKVGVDGSAVTSSLDYKVASGVGVSFPFRIAAGNVYGGAASTTVTYPAGRFTVTPIPIFVNIDSTYIPSGSSFTSSGFTYINSVAGNATLSYIAIQMTSTTSAG